MITEDQSGLTAEEKEIKRERQLERAMERKRFKDLEKARKKDD